jgi:hypothetical protein
MSKQTPSLPDPEPAHDATRKKQIPFRHDVADHMRDGITQAADLLEAFEPVMMED